MKTVKVLRDEAHPFAAKLCKEIDARWEEWLRIREVRFPLLVFALVLAVGGASAILHGEDAELVRNFGELASAFSFGGIPVFGGWLIADQLRLKAISRENTAAYAELTRLGYEHIHGEKRHLYRVLPET